MRSSYKYFYFFIVTYIFMIVWDYFNNDAFNWISNIFQSLILLIVFALFNSFTRKKIPHK